jgi:hypothetical protein
MAIMLIVALAVPLSAQSGANNKVFVSYAEGGSESAKEYFDYELFDATWLLGYELADTIEESGYYITVNLQEDNGVNSVAVALHNTESNEQIAANAMGYEKPDDMDGWNRYLINELMMGASITRSSTAGGIAVGGTAVSGTVNGGTAVDGPAYGENETAVAQKYPRYWMYLGLQGAYSARFYSDPVKGASGSNWDLGHTYEAGIRISGQVLPWLAIQSETTFTQDVAKNTNTGTTYDSLSLKFPLLLKVTLRFGDFLIAPLGGAYYNIALGNIKVTTDGGSVFQEYNWNYYNFRQGLGWIAGLEVGYRLGPGTLFFGARYSADLDSVIVEGNAAYRRAGITASLGYDFGLFRKIN